MPASAAYWVISGRARRLAVSREILAIAGRVRSDAQSRTPRGRTGTLKGAWKTGRGRDPGTALVINEVPYASAVEYGHRGRPPAAMLGRAMAATGLPRWKSGGYR